MHIQHQRGGFVPETKSPGRAGKGNQTVVTNSVTAIKALAGQNPQLKPMELLSGDSPAVGLLGV